MSDKAMMTGIKTDIKDRYASGLIDEEKAEELLVKAGIVEEEKVKETVYDWKAKNRLTIGGNRLIMETYRLIIGGNRLTMKTNRLIMDFYWLQNMPIR